MPELWFALGAGLFSSLHCVGMCGPIVAGWQRISSEPVQIELGAAVRPGAITLRRTLVIPQVLYHAGRIVSYASIGMIAGTIGTAATITPIVQQTFTITFGVLMIVTAFFQLNVFRREKSSSHNKIYSALRALVSSRATESRFLIGLFTPLLPCGLLYGMVLHSAVTNSAVLGALEMGVFAAGAAPALMVVAAASHSFGTALRTNGTTVAAIFIIVMGLLTILRGAGIYQVPFLSHSEPVCRGTTSQVLEQQ